MNRKADKSCPRDKAVLSKQQKLQQTNSANTTNHNGVIREEECRASDKDPSVEELHGKLPNRHSQSNDGALSHRGIFFGVTLYVVVFNGCNLYLIKARAVLHCPCNDVQEKTDPFRVKLSKFSAELSFAVSLESEIIRKTDE
ncbi:hypothetical protein JOB18_006465 [Solea senegalensis]|uniref:Uncharacterized protein n=1 Tax=Solea senegalensis TaxID=28829 RepID=A0AAV6PVI7_SOLSE|nr:hypothetical protein JOB18_006465 [Solea senegalensis]